MPTTNVTNQKPLTTYSGDYYVGMKQKEAEEKKIYKKTIGIDFRDIDKDKNKELSWDEIADARRKEADRKSYIGIGVAATGMVIMTAGAIGEILSVGTGTPVCIPLEIYGSELALTGMAVTGVGMGTAVAGSEERFQAENKNINSTWDTVKEMGKHAWDGTKSICQDIYDYFTK